MIKLHLASASPRRVAILKSLGLNFTAQGVDVDETPHAEEQSADMVVRLAVEKAKAAGAAPDQVTIGSDTAVVVAGETLGKPRDQVDAVRMLRCLSARRHEVMTGVAVLGPRGLDLALSITGVWFREIHQDEIVRYWQSGEPRDKAGGYAIQGLGGAFVVSMAGSYSGVVGLPVFETVQLLEKAGIQRPVKES